MIEFRAIEVESNGLADRIDTVGAHRSRADRHRVPVARRTDAADQGRPAECQGRSAADAGRRRRRLTVDCACCCRSASLAQQHLRAAHRGDRGRRDRAAVGRVPRRADDFPALGEGLGSSHPARRTAGGRAAARLAARSWRSARCRICSHGTSWRRGSNRAPRTSIRPSRSKPTWRAKRRCSAKRAHRSTMWCRRTPTR